MAISTPRRLRAGGAARGRQPGRGHLRQISAPLHPRPYGEVAKFFTGLELIDPGVVAAAAWRSEWSDQNEGKVHLSYGGVARKP